MAPGRVKLQRKQVNNDLTTSRLLPPETLRWMRRAFGVSNRFATTPFQWRPDEFAPTRNTKGWRKIVWLFNSALSVCHVGFCIRQWYETMENEQATLTSKIFMMFTVVWGVYGVCLQTSNILRRDSLPMYTKSFIGFLGDLRGFVQKKDSLPVVKMGKFVFVITYNSTRVLAILYGGLAYVRPANPAFWSSILPAATQEIWPIRALLALIHFYMYMLLCDAGCIYITVGFPYLFALLDTVRLMSNRAKERHGHVPIRRMFQLYQQLRLLTNVYDHVNTIVLVSTKSSFIIFAMLGTCGCLRTKGMMSALFAEVGLFSVVVLVVYMMLLGELHSRSTDFLSVVKTEMAAERRIGEVWTRRQLRSMPAMSIKVGSMYFIDKPIVMTTCQILFDNCINFLLMTA